MGEYIYEVLFDFPAEDEGELSIYAGECVRSSTDVDDEGWLFVTSEDNSSGYVPKEYLRLIPGGTSTSESKSTKNDVVATSNANLEVTKTAVEEAPIQKVELEVASSPKIQSPVVEAIKPSPLPATAPESATPESTAPVSLSTPLMPVSYQAAAPSIVPPPHLQSSEVDSTPAPSASTTSRVSKSSTAGAMSSSHTSATPMRSVSQNPVSPTYSMSSASKLSFSKAGKGVLAASKLASLGTSINTSKTIAPPRPPALVAAVERDNMADLLKKNDDYFNRVINSQSETLDSVTDMLDSLTKKLSDATQTSNEFVSKLNQLDEIIDDEKRKWKTQMENERNSSITERNKILINEYSSGSSMHTNKSDSSSGSPK